MPVQGCRFGQGTRHGWVWPSNSREEWCNNMAVYTSVGGKKGMNHIRATWNANEWTHECQKVFANGSMFLRNDHTEHSRRSHCERSVSRCSGKRSTDWPPRHATRSKHSSCSSVTIVLHRGWSKSLGNPTNKFAAKTSSATYTYKAYRKTPTFSTSWWLYTLTVGDIWPECSAAAKSERQNFHFWHSISWGAKTRVMHYHTSCVKTCAINLDGS